MSFINEEEEEGCLLPCSLVEIHPFLIVHWKTHLWRLSHDLRSRNSVALKYRLSGAVGILTVQA